MFMTFRSQIEFDPDIPLPSVFGLDEDRRRSAFCRKDGFFGGAGTYGDPSFFSFSFVPGEYAAPKGFGDSNCGLALAGLASFNCSLPAGVRTGPRFEPGLEVNLELRFDIHEFRR
jgi:hypothetical protein